MSILFISKIHDQNKLDKAWFQHGMTYGVFKIYPEEQLLIKYSLHEKCPNTEFFLVLIFLYLD